MMIRIVKMTFEPEHIGRFQELFVGWQPLIRSFPGCRHLEMLHDVDDPRVFFTYSRWDGSKDLEAYQVSDVFAGGVARGENFLRRTCGGLDSGP